MSNSPLANVDPDEDQDENRPIPLLDRPRSVLWWAIGGSFAYYLGSQIAAVLLSRIVDFETWVGISLLLSWLAPIAAWVAVVLAVPILIARNAPRKTDPRQQTLATGRWFQRVVGYVTTLIIGAIAGAIIARAYDDAGTFQPQRADEPLSSANVETLSRVAGIAFACLGILLATAVIAVGVWLVIIAVRLIVHAKYEGRLAAARRLLQADSAANHRVRRDAWARHLSSVGYPISLIVLVVFYWLVVVALSILAVNLMYNIVVAGIESLGV